MRGELWMDIRNDYLKGLSISEISRKHNINWRTAKKYATSKEVPKYTLKKKKPSKLDDFKPMIDELLEEAPYSAVRILELLKGTNHYVATGVSILKAGTNLRRIFCEVTEVIFKNYTYDDIKNYINSGEPWDKAGGYAIQGKWKKYIDHYIGDYENVVGFPWKRIQKELNSLND